MADERRSVVPPPIAGQGSAEPRPPQAPAQVSSARRGPPLQFSMRTMLIAVTGIAILAALTSVLGSRLAVGLFGYFLAMAATSVAPVCFGTLALYVRGPRQTFFLGAFVGSLIPVFSGSSASYPAMREMGIVPYVLLLSINLASALAFGWLALATRRFAERRGWDVPPVRGDSEKRN